MPQEQYTIRMPSGGDKKTEPITVQQLAIRTVIVGKLSVTELDMTFYNPNDRRLEGTFELPLPAGWELAKFALDINGHLRPAVTVPKAKGREAFEAVVRRGVDPALVERVAGNLFKARVYPFEPKGVRRVVVTLDHELDATGSMDAFIFPYTFDYPIPQFSLNLRVAERPIQAATIEGLPDIPFTTARRESVLEYNHKEVALEKPFSLKLTRNYTLSPIFAKDGERWFYAMPVSTKMLPTPVAKPKRVVLLWDTSESQRKTDKKKGFTLLQSYLKWMETGEVVLYPFSVSCDKGKTFTVTDGTCDELVAVLEKLRYDGATDLNRIPWKALKGDAILLFSDAIQTLPTLKTMPAPMAPVYCISAGTVYEKHWLRGLATRSDGAYVDLKTLAPEQALQLLTTRQPFVKAWGTDAPDYVAPTAIPPAGNLWLYGTASRTPQTLSSLFSDGKKETAKLKEEAVIPWTDEDIVSLLRRCYIRREIQCLRETGKEREAEHLAQEHAMVTDKSSLIVLEEVSDYVKYAIRPPQELQKEYDRLIQQQEEKEKEQKEAVLESLVKMSDEQTKWWEGKIKPEPVVRESRGGTVRSVLFGRSAARSAVREEEEAFAEPMMAAESDKVATALHQPQRSGSISITAWDSDSPYLKVLQYAEKGAEETTYFRLKEEYGDVPAFYLDAAGFFFRKAQKELAYRILTNILESNIDMPELLRAVARTLEQEEMLAEAELIYRKVAELAPHEPQSLLDLGLLLSRKGEHAEAVEMLYRVAMGNWQQRFNGVNLIAMNELNAIVNAHPEMKFDLSNIDKRLLKKEPVDVRIVLTWANDNSDVDLHVIDPEKEECYYGRKITQSLGKLSNDITRGYGPEEFMQRRGMRGKYRIKAKLYSNRSQGVMVPQYIYARCYLYYGTPHQKMEELSFRIEQVKDMVEIGTIEF